MNNVFDALEKYKFGLLAALLVYVGVFVYFMFGTYNAGGDPYSPFHQGPILEVPEEDIELKPENIMLPADADFTQVKNAARDANDSRERSNSNYGMDGARMEPIMDVTERERQMLKEAGGEAERAKIRQQMAARKERERLERQNANTPNTSKPGDGSSKAVAGTVLVEWNVPTRGPHQGIATNIPAPGYTCDGGNGSVVVNVTVDQGGRVTSATYNPGMSRGATTCMISKARQYALKSRFNYSSSAASSQSGTITYIFVP